MCKDGRVWGALDVDRRPNGRLHRRWVLRRSIRLATVLGLVWHVAMVRIAAAALHGLLVVRSIGTDEPGQRRQREDEHEAPAAHLRDQTYNEATVTWRGVAFKSHGHSPCIIRSKHLTRSSRVYTLWGYGYQQRIALGRLGRDSRAAMVLRRAGCSCAIRRGRERRGEPHRTARLGLFCPERGVDCAGQLARFGARSGGSRRSSMDRYLLDGRGGVMGLAIRAVSRVVEVNRCPRALFR